jgi:hypothetical protein
MLKKRSVWIEKNKVRKNKSFYYPKRKPGNCLDFFLRQKVFCCWIPLSSSLEKQMVSIALLCEMWCALKQLIATFQSCKLFIIYGLSQVSFGRIEVKNSAKENGNGDISVVL